ncbi:Crp/Fnr family transcriptional regulator [Sphingomonas sp. BGYR3]|uniref:Crp/Fnr family transcriptional regulator n=1 Tax=Sphingomonas sp. BGYR3 TaxID=2975483 RepID=UPI0021A89CC8|nr:Crp/Fnr family transcriptional regulator [Sphingomonas sp. BGYR3]MDG5487823.1 Crp/Fnr family transcriptional regulator [Sphingomonas sp. BGYR3]
MVFERFLTNRREFELTAEEMRLLDGAVSTRRIVDARTTMIKAGERVTSSTMLVRGFMSRYIDDPAGLRQLVAVHVSGEFVDLHAYPMRELDHSVGTLTQCEVAIIPHDALKRVLDGHESLSRKLWFSTLLDAALHRAWLFRVGRLDALGRVAHLFCEMNARLESAGLSDGNAFELPLTQADIAEICGLTAVHVNRVLRQLREGGLCQFRSGSVTLINPAALARRGHFDPHYLYLKTMPTARWPD